MEKVLKEKFEMIVEVLKTTIYHFVQLVYHLLAISLLIAINCAYRSLLPYTTSIQKHKKIYVFGY